MVESQPYWFRRHPKTTLALTVVVGVGLGLVVLEIGARIFLAEMGPAVGGERTTFSEYDALLGWAHRPDMQATFSRRKFSVDVSINSDRLRDREYPHERSDMRRMLVLGDSFGWGYGVEHVERFDEVLESRHPDWEIINASVSGYGTDQQLLYLTERGWAYDPDVVLLLFYRNDFTNNRAGAQYSTNKPYFVLESDGIELRNTPVPRPTVVQRFARFVGTTYVLGRVYLGLKRWVKSLNRSNRSKGDFALTRRLIEELHRVSRAHGALFVLVSIPMSTGERTVLHELSEGLGFPYLALDARFDEQGLVFPHDGHWNAKGHRAAADAIEGFLQECGVL